MRAFQRCLAVVLVAACARTATAQVSIRGRVVSDATGDPIRNARIVVDDRADAASATDADGRFVAAAPAQPSGHVIAVSKTGYALVRAKVEGDTVDVRMARGGAIAGRLLDAFGSPIPLFSVAALRVVRSGGRAALVRQTNVETDEAGEFRLFDLPAGEFVVGVGGGRTFTSVSTPSLPREIDGLRLFYPNAATIEKAARVAVGAGEEVDGIDMSMPVPALPGTPPRAPAPRANGASISGRIVRSNGTPVRRARVTLESAESLFSPYNVLADDEGRYEFQNLAAGRYVLAATDLNLVVGVYGERQADDRGEVISVQPGRAVENVDVAMPRAGSIGGRLVDEYGDPVGGVNVRVEQIRVVDGRQRVVRVAGVAVRQTDDRGRYRVFGLPPGRYLVDAIVGEHVAGWVTNDLPGYGRTYFPGALAAAEAQPVELRAGEDLSTIDFALARGGETRIAGRVLDPAAQPFSGSVYLMPSARSRAVVDNGFPMRVRTADGSFVFSRLPPGDYVIQAATSPLDRAIEGAFGAAFVSVGGVGADDVVVRMSGGSTIAGRLAFDGEPPASPEGFEISARPADPDLRSLADNAPARAEPDGDWNFALGGLNGPRRLVVQAPAGWTLKSVVVNGVDANGAPIACGRPDDSVSGVEIVMARVARP